MSDWDTWQKVLVIILVNTTVLTYTVWLLWLSRWARPKAKKEDVR